MTPASPPHCRYVKRRRENRKWNRKRSNIITTVLPIKQIVQTQHYQQRRLFRIKLWVPTTTIATTTMIQDEGETQDLLTNRIPGRAVWRDTGGSNEWYIQNVKRSIAQVTTAAAEPIRIRRNQDGHRWGDWRRQAGPEQTRNGKITEGSRESTKKRIRTPESVSMKNYVPIIRRKTDTTTTTIFFYVVVVVAHQVSDHTTAACIILLLRMLLFRRTVL